MLFRSYYEYSFDYLIIIMNQLRLTCYLVYSTVCSLPDTDLQNFIPCQLPFQMMPNVFNGVNVWRLCKPVHNLIFMVLKPLFGLFSSVLGVIILLKDNVILGFVVKLDAFLKFFFQDLHIKVPIHLPINLACIPNLLPCHASPHHQGSTSKLLFPLHQPIT